MKHATPETLQGLDPVLRAVRQHAELTERKAGTFYLKGSAFLHFHEDPKGLFADLKLQPGEFTRFPVNGPREVEILLSEVQRALAVHHGSGVKAGELGFTYRSRKDGSVEVLHHDRLASTLRGRDAASFIGKVDALSQTDAQRLMARVTGNYKRGNERSSGGHQRNRG
jgi:hypothetical protein